jgi:hypothetical protein
MVMEGSSTMLTLTIDRNPSDTRRRSGEKSEYSYEEVEVMLTAGAGTTAGMGDYTLPAMVTFEEWDGTGSSTDSMMVEVMATMDDDIDEDHMLVVDAEVVGTESANGPNTDYDMYSGVSTVTIMDETPVLVWANPMNVVEKIIYDAKAAGMGDDMMFSIGEMFEVDASLLFDHNMDMPGLTIEYAASSDDEVVASASATSGMVMVTAMSAGMAHVTVTATATSTLPSGVKIVTQTEPNVAQILIPVEVMGAVPVLPIIAQLLLAGLLGMGGFRRYLRR